MPAITPTGLIRNMMLYWPVGLRRDLCDKLATVVHRDALVALGGAETLPHLGQFRVRVNRRWAFYQLDHR